MSLLFSDVFSHLKDSFGTPNIETDSYYSKIKNNYACYNDDVDFNLIQAMSESLNPNYQHDQEELEGKEESLTEKFEIAAVEDEVADESQVSKVDSRLPIQYTPDNSNLQGTDENGSS